MALPVGARVWFSSGEGPNSEWRAGTTVSTAGERVSVKRDEDGQVVEVDGASVHMANKEDVEVRTLCSPGAIAGQSKSRHARSSLGDASLTPKSLLGCL